MVSLLLATWRDQAHQACSDSQLLTVALALRTSVRETRSSWASLMPASIIASSRSREMWVSTWKIQPGSDSVKCRDLAR